MSHITFEILMCLALIKQIASLLRALCTVAIHVSTHADRKLSSITLV